MAAKVEISNQGCHYGNGMAHREVKITGVKGLEKEIKVLVTNKLSEAICWSKRHSPELGFISDLDVGIHYVDGPLRKEGTMLLMTFYICCRGECYALAFEGKKTSMPNAARQIVRCLEREVVAGTASTFDLVNFKGDFIVKQFNELSDVLPMKPKEDLQTPVHDGAIDEDLILEGVSIAAVCYKFGKKN